MKIIIISDSYSPANSSAAVQIHDLAIEFVRQGHSPTILVPSSDQDRHWQLEHSSGIQILRVKTPQLRGSSYLSRTLAELIMPFAMIQHYHKSPLAKEQWDGLVCYSPSIFHGPLVHFLKKTSGCRSYLILRDIFPDWALDIGLLTRSLPYYFFKIVAHYQYMVADFIGVQSSGNKEYLSNRYLKTGQKTEILQNWLDRAVSKKCSIQISKTPLSGRKIFVYAGNMGKSQGMDILLNLSEKMQGKLDIGFLFVGRGSEVMRIKSFATERKINNILFFDEIGSDEIPGLYAQCSVGMIALDSKHKSHNIPGKFLTYIRSGLPVLANINLGNDLGNIIRSERVGQVTESNKINELVHLTENILAQIESDPDLRTRCYNLFHREFSVKKSVSQIVSALSIGSVNIQ